MCAAQVESILKPVRGIRDAQRRAGITPTNHSRHNIQAVKEQSRLNALQKAQQQDERISAATGGLRRQSGAGTRHAGASTQDEACRCALPSFYQPTQCAWHTHTFSRHAMPVLLLDLQPQVLVPLEAGSSTSSPAGAAHLALQATSAQQGTLLRRTNWQLLQQQHVGQSRQRPRPEQVLGSTCTSQTLGRCVCVCV